jgi:hypothetical protein
VDGAHQTGGGRGHAHPVVGPQRVEPQHGGDAGGGGHGRARRPAPLVRRVGRRERQLGDRAFYVGEGDEVEIPPGAGCGRRRGAGTGRRGRGAARHAGRGAGPRRRGGRGVGTGRHGVGTGRRAGRGPLIRVESGRLPGPGPARGRDRRVAECAGGEADLAGVPVRRGHLPGVIADRGLPIINAAVCVLGGADAEHASPGPETHSRPACSPDGRPGPGVASPRGRHRRGRHPCAQATA